MSNNARNTSVFENGNNTLSTRALVVRIVLFTIVLCAALGLIGLSQQLFGSHPSVPSRRDKNNKRVFYIHEKLLTRMTIYMFVLACWFIIFVATLYFTQKKYAIMLYDQVLNAARTN